MTNDGRGLINDVGLVGLGHLHFAHADEAFHPTGIEIDKVGRSATNIGEVLDGKTQTSRPGRSDHEPVSSLREKVRSIVI